MEKVSLTAALAELRPKIGEPYRSLNNALVKRLIDLNFTEFSLKAGDRCPDFALLNAEGRVVRARDLFAQGTTVFSFYRGVWCPFCSAELEAFHAAVPSIRAAGGQLVAISAEANGAPLRIKRERKFEFEILCDLDNGLSLAFGLVFRVPDELIKAFSTGGLDFPIVYGNDSWFLPIPATYVVGGDGVILSAYVNPDFRERLDPKDLIEIVETSR